MNHNPIEPVFEWIEVHEGVYRIDYNKHFRIEAFRVEDRYMFTINMVAYTGRYPSIEAAKSAAELKFIELLSPKKP